MTKYNTINRKKIMFIFGMALIIATTFFYINHARMDDFTSLITDTTIQYQEEGAMKDYTSDVELKDNTPLSISIKATVPQGTLASIGEDETVVKNETLTYNLPEQLQIEDNQSNKLYLEDNLDNSIGSYEIKNNVLTMNFDEEHINTNAENELKIALVLDTDSSHVTYDANGEKMGSKECEEGQIFIEPQGFAIMSDIGKDQGCDKKTLAAIDERLNTQHGLVLNNPAFTKYYIQYGEISTYPGGYKENAGIFTHNNAWIICAAAYAGAGDQAFKYYSEIAPAFTEETSDIHKTEPYVYGQMIGGKDAGSDIGKPGNHFGQGKNSWLTGTAAWNMVAISQYILGISADFDGLKIDPSIPAAWDGMNATRQFRGATYDIKVTNPDHVNKGIKSVTVDGNAIEGNVLPVFGDGKTHAVEVVMG